MGNKPQGAVVAGKPVVLVLGGGYVGCTAARALDESGKFNVVLIDRKSFFLHNVASLRATVDPSWIEKIMIPYDKLLRNGMVVQAEVEEVASTYVKLHGREDPVKFDFLVIALGSSYAFPSKISETTREAARQKYTDLHKVLVQKDDICIIGGGPVGVELAGEIKTDYPKKNVTVVQSQDKLVPGPFTDKFKAEIHSKLTKLGVRVLLGQRVELDDDTKQGFKTGARSYLEGRRTITTTKGEKIDADLTFMCVGLAVNNEALRQHFSGFMENGRLRVNQYLQVEGHKNVFAVGDINNTPELKMAYFGQMQAELVAKNIRALQKGHVMKAHTSPTPAMMVTVGRNGGVGQLPVGCMVVGDTVIKRIKAKDIFLSEYNSLLRQTIDKENKHRTGVEHIESRTMNLAAAMNISEEDAKTLMVDGLAEAEHEVGATHT